MDTLHPTKPFQAQTGTLGFRVEGYDYCRQLLPRNDLVHLNQKYYFACLLPVLIKTATDQTRLIKGGFSVSLAICGIISG